MFMNVASYLVRDASIPVITGSAVRSSVGNADILIIFQAERIMTAVVYAVLIGLNMVIYQELMQTELRLAVIILHLTY